MHMNSTKQTTNQPTNEPANTSMVALMLDFVLLMCPRNWISWPTNQAEVTNAASQNDPAKYCYYVVEKCEQSISKIQCEDRHGSNMLQHAILNVSQVAAQKETPKNIEHVMFSQTT